MDIFFPHEYAFALQRRLAWRVVWKSWGDVLKVIVFGSKAGAIQISVIHLLESRYASLAVYTAR